MKYPRHGNTVHNVSQFRKDQGPGVRSISADLVSSQCRHQRAWYIDQHDRSCDHRCQKKSEYVFHLHFHDEGVAVGSKRVLMLERQTEIFRFRSFQLVRWTNEQMQSHWNYFSFWGHGASRGLTWCAAFPHFFTKNPLLSSHAFWTKKYLGP